MRYSVPAPPKAPVAVSAPPVALSSSELGIPGVHLVQEFVTAAEEQELLAAVDSRPWKRLAKRRVQHYGYEFLYETRNVDSKQFLGELPSFVSKILDKIVTFPGVKNCTGKLVDQLTVSFHVPTTVLVSTERGNCSLNFLLLVWSRSNYGFLFLLIYH
ncbi:unnamed protein product [Triticum turgidum subsp. durum]|uniref:Uncharacterized protein n=1 Tax=Triticum turgidum subsp. durum TaxID=4567 RepID=A0A9R1P3W5_TRITD|nr:unnamed protein product [Triticum turgidum subsp. durum]